MNILIYSSLVAIIMMLISNGLGNFLKPRLLVNSTIIPELLGLITWIGLLSILEYCMLLLNFSKDTIFTVFFGVSIIIFGISIKSVRWNYTRYESIFVIIFSIVLVIISLKYRLGEQMGDNTYLMNMVSMNNIRPYFNFSEFDNGFYYGFNNISVNKVYLTWYHFFSFLTFYVQKFAHSVSVNYIPSALIFVWTGNITFYLLSSMVFINVSRQFKIKSRWMLFSLFLLTLYWGTIYYNLVLAHYGTNFVSLFVIGLWYLLTYTKVLNIKSVSLIILNIYALAAMGNVGLIVSAFVVFAYVVYEIWVNNTEIFKWIPLMLFPIFHWVAILKDIIPVNWLIPIIVVISALSWLIHYINSLKLFIFKYIKYILIITLIVWYLIAIIKADNYILLFYDFFNPKSNFDRLQDYFSFVNLLDSLRNFAVYIAIASLFLNSKTRKIGQMVLIILLFFINPIIYPILNPPLQWLYHRAYISVFNMFVFMLGTCSLFDYLLSKASKTKYLLMTLWMLLLIPSTYQQITGYFHRIYIPGPDFNVFYKLDNDQIEVLEKLRQIVEIENYENAKVISQIYGTTMYVPQVYHMYFNYANRRIYDPNIDYENFEPLYRIFYTPVFDGDDGPRFNAPYEQTCSLLIDNKVDFIIYKKELSAFDQACKNWIPIHWYARGCADRVFENEDYIMYRFFWN